MHAAFVACSPTIRGRATATHFCRPFPTNRAPLNLLTCQLFFFEIILLSSLSLADWIKANIFPRLSNRTDLRLEPADMESLLGPPAVGRAKAGLSRPTDLEKVLSSPGTRSTVRSSDAMLTLCRTQLLLSALARTGKYLHVQAVCASSFSVGRDALKGLCRLECELRCSRRCSNCSYRHHCPPCRVS